MAKDGSAANSRWHRISIAIALQSCGSHPALAAAATNPPSRKWKLHKSATLGPRGASAVISAQITSAALGMPLQLEGFVHHARLVAIGDLSQQQMSKQRVEQCQFACTACHMPIATCLPDVGWLELIAEPELHQRVEPVAGSEPRGTDRMLRRGGEGGNHGHHGHHGLHWLEKACNKLAAVRRTT